MEFQEKQGLSLWWLYILIGIDAIIILSIVLFDKGGMSFEQLKAVYFAPLWAVFLPLTIVFLLQKNKLTLTVNELGISYRYFPFRNKTRLLPWGTVEKVWFHKYDALGDYGGWGVRYRLWFKFSDKAYLMNDKDKGLQIEFKNGKRLLFSTNKCDAFELFMANLKARYQIQAIQ